MCTSHLAFPPVIFLKFKWSYSARVLTWLQLGSIFKSKWCNYTIILTWLQLGSILLLFYQRDQISILSITCFRHAYVDIAFSRWDTATEVFELYFRGFPFNGEMASSWTHFFFLKANFSCCLFQNTIKRHIAY